MELACGLGATVLLVVVLIVIYHAYWLEMVLFYRAHFGTDETILGKDLKGLYLFYPATGQTLHGQDKSSSFSKSLVSLVTLCKDLRIQGDLL